MIGFNKEMRKLDKQMEEMKKNYAKYNQISKQNLLNISYEDMLFMIKMESMAKPVAEFQKYIPSELEAKIIDDDLLAIKNKYPKDESVNDMLKVLQMIRITDFRVKQFLEVGQRLDASKDDPTYESYGAVKLLIYWSAFAPIRKIINKYDRLDDLFTTDFHMDIFDKFVDETVTARENFNEVSIRLTKIEYEKSNQRLERMREQKRQLQEQMRGFGGRF